MNLINSTPPTPTHDVSLPTERKPYQAPAVTYEARLEVRAGSPPGILDPLDLFD